MACDLRFIRFFGLGVAIAASAGGLAGCAAFGAEVSDPGPEAPPVVEDRSGDGSKARTPAKAEAPPPPATQADVLDFGDVECNVVVPARKLTTPSAPSDDAAWNTTLEGTSFQAQPASGTLTKGEAATFDVLAPTIKNTTTLEPIAATLTVALLGTDRNKTIALRMQPRGAILRFEDGALTFGNLTSALAGPRTTKLTNDGNAAVSFSIASDTEGFAVTPSTLTLAPHESTQISVKLVQTGTYAGKAVITATIGGVCFASPLTFAGSLL